MGEKEGKLGREAEAREKGLKNVVCDVSSSSRVATYGRNCPNSQPPISFFSPFHDVIVSDR